MIRVSTKRNGISKSKVIFFMVIGISIFYLYPNLLLLTNKVNLYINKQFFLKEIRSYGLIETDFLKAHIHHALPIVKVIHDEEIHVLEGKDIVRWLSTLITGFDIKKPRTILSSQIPVLKDYDKKTVFALGMVNESVLAQEDNAEHFAQHNGKAEDNGKIIEIGEPTEQTEDKTNQVNPVQGANKINIKNETSYPIDIPSMLNEKLKIKFDKKGPQVLIVHTHTSEAYTPSENSSYNPSGSDRTEDPRYNVTRVGEEIAKYLQSKGISVIHDKTVHDYPVYNGSYAISLKTIEKNLEKYPSIQIVLDVHRDGLTQPDGTKLKVSAQVNNKKVSQVMLVVGTNEGGLEHPEWKENLKFALRLQKKMNDLYPNFARPLNLRKERFNQHATYGSLIMEVGSNGNSLEESVASAEYIANALAEVIKEIR